MSESYNQVCYVLTSNAKDIYANMNLLSAWSLQQSNPNMHIILLCDTDTMKALQKNDHQILKTVNEIISVDTPAGPAGFRNRYIKTSMNRHMKGPFLYLDADTLIRGDISPIFSTSASFSAVANHSGSGAPSEIPEKEIAFFKRMNWCAPKKYVNGGVLYFSDHLSVNMFFELWHRKWLDFNSRTGEHCDQPILNRALDENEIDFSWMNQCYNAQLLARPKMACGAVIWHFYYSDNQAAPKTVFDLGLKQLSMSKKKKKELVNIIIQSNHPYIRNNSIDRLAVKNIIRNNQIMNRQSWECLWLSDDYTGACKSIVRLLKQNAFKLLK